MKLKDYYLSEIYMRICDSDIENIQVAYELFKNYGFDLDKEKPNENGNILCDGCENCFNCINCSGCDNCKNCWCLCGLDGCENMFSIVDYVENLRNEPLNEKDKTELQEIIDVIDDHIEMYKSSCKHLE